MAYLHTTLYTGKTIETHHHPGYVGIRHRNKHFPNITHSHEYMRELTDVVCWTSIVNYLNSITPKIKCEQLELYSCIVYFITVIPLLLLLLYYTTGLSTPPFSQKHHPREIHINEMCIRYVHSHKTDGKAAATFTHSR